MRLHIEGRASTVKAREVVQQLTLRMCALGNVVRMGKTWPSGRKSRSREPSEPARNGGVPKILGTPSYHPFIDGVSMK